jgi:hypothetical protein
MGTGCVRLCFKTNVKNGLGRNLNQFNNLAEAGL